MHKCNGRRGTGAESRELAAGEDGDSGAGTGGDGAVVQWRGWALRETRLFVIRMGA
jgi:hypothetical protein